MKFCTSCGTQLDDAVIYCPNCGASNEQQSAPKQPVVVKKQPDNGRLTDMQGIILFMMILGTVIMGLSFFLIPLAWCIPMTIIYYNNIKNHQPISVGFKVCSLLFVSMIGGILMLCDND